MKRLLKVFGALIGPGILIVVILFASLPWMDRWGAADEEINASLLGEELVPSPSLIYTRAISIIAPPENVYPWIAQFGAPASLLLLEVEQAGVVARGPLFRRVSSTPHTPLSPRERDVRRTG